VREESIGAVSVQGDSRRAKLNTRLSFDSVGDVGSAYCPSRERWNLSYLTLSAQLKPYLSDSPKPNLIRGQAPGFYLL